MPVSVDALPGTAGAEQPPLPSADRRSLVPSRRATEQRLLRKYHQTGDRRDRDVIVERFLPLARSLARRYRGGSEPLEDLEQVAYMALVRAVHGFDASRTTAFTSYAVPCIAGAIKRHFRDCGWSVRVPRDLQELALRVERTSAELFSATGTAPGVSELAERIGVCAEDVLEAREAYKAMRSYSLDQPRHDRGSDDSGSLLDTLTGADDDLGLALERAALETLLDTLGDRDRMIVTLYFQGDCTQAEIGRRLGYSQMHVSRLLRQAVERLRAAAEQQQLTPAPVLASAA